jgi:hypothetical protein
MFGSAERLEKDLGENGKSAQAEITAAKQGKFAVSTGSNAAEQAASAHVSWKLTLRVTPDGESPFDAEIKESYPEFGAPSVGDAIGVLYDPNDHSRVVVDHSSAGEATEALSHISEGTQAAMAKVGGESAHDMMQEAIDNPKAFQEKMRERASEMNANALAAAGVQAPTPWAGVPQGVAHPDPADEIAKLADLRDRGALTDEEFEAQKKKILGT